MRAATLRQCVILPGQQAVVGGRAFAAWLMREMLRFGVDEFVILTGRLDETARDAMLNAADALPKRVGVVLSEALAEAGTGGALFAARALLHDRFLLCHGDSLFDCNIAALLSAFVQDDTGVIGHAVLREAPDAARHATVVLDGRRIVAFREKRSGPGIVPAGIYAFDKGVAGMLRPECSLEDDILPRLAADGALRGSVQHGWFADITVADDLAHAQRELAMCMDRPALFLDRDGVLNVDHGFVGSRERWEWMPGAREAVALATGHGWHVFIVTNQAGVARGLYGEAEVGTLQDWVADELRRAGGTLDDWRHCPYHSEAKIESFRKESDWRKPAPGMLLDLLRVWDVDPRRCLMVGDRDIDMQAAQAAGVAGHLFTGGNLAEFVAPLLGR